MEGIRNAYRILVGKSLGKPSTWRIEKMRIREGGWKWIGIVSNGGLWI
jgi:hypothetical protein